MYCVNCGKKLDNGLAFCTECGHKITKTEEKKEVFSESSDFAEKTDHNSENAGNNENNGNRSIVKKGNMILSIIIAGVITFFIFVSMEERFAALGCFAFALIVAFLANGASGNLLIGIVSFIIAGMIYTYPSRLLFADHTIPFILGILINMAPVVIIIAVILYELNESRKSTE